MDLPDIDFPTTLQTPSLPGTPWGGSLPTNWWGDDSGGFRLPTGAPDAGSSGGFSWGNFPDIIAKIGKGLEPIGQLGAIGLKGWSELNAQRQARDYQKTLDAYYKNRAQIESDYNKQVQDYLERRKAWESEVAGTFEGAAGQFGERMGQFQEQMTTALGNAQKVIDQQIAEAQPLFAQSRSLLEPAVAALAKGEVPPMLRPIFEQMKARARAVGMQSLASAGIEEGTAHASLEQQIELQAFQALYQAAATMVAQGQGLATQGFGALDSAGKTVGTEATVAGSMFDPVMREFQLMMQAITSLFGGFPSPIGGQAPPAPVA